ncbi:tRNA (adenosine(37)-N6)-threonylcarbamoyltransferase complex ATPase subunit type 1 TsaE [Anaerolineales bacterium HSG6]|nr:tRNA (adenosine(37)-N6)-threonylcarbamoyltransferase complex ATPase subunit type 1 TsaE [Anaerolineales bacterium HSG6]MDM8531974.1 tRNA (adenosine(37)-N6)-threonylcarbamoyltransferase complex ATPase subunit type 1 TsaE [Anaerolineales bacterium HSG25]
MSPILEPNTLDFISHSELQTHRLGARLGSLLEPSDVIALVGELGTGKTRWVQGICQGLTVTDRVISPTFTLVNEYDGRLPVYHIDLYRLTGAVDGMSFGLEDYMYDSGVTLIEWADRAMDVLPDAYMVVELYHLSETRRRVVLRPYGSRFVNLLKVFKKRTFAR